VKGADYVEKFGLVFGSGLVTSVGDKHKGEGYSYMSEDLHAITTGSGGATMASLSWEGW